MSNTELIIYSIIFLLLFIILYYSIKIISESVLYHYTALKRRDPIRLKNYLKILISTFFVSTYLLIVSFNTFHNYDVYIILRILVSIYSVIVGAYLLDYLKYVGYYLFINAILFNPFFPFHFSQSTWQTIDLLTAIMIPMIVLLALSRKPSSDTTSVVQEKTVPSHEKDPLPQVDQRPIIQDSPKKEIASLPKSEDIQNSKMKKSELAAKKLEENNQCLLAKKFLIYLLSNYNHDLLPLSKKIFYKEYANQVIDFLCNYEKFDLSEFNEVANKKTILMYDKNEYAEDENLDSLLALHRRLEKYIKWCKFFYKTNSYDLIVYRDKNEITIAALQKKYDILSKDIWDERQHILEKYPKAFISWDNTQLDKLFFQIDYLKTRNAFINKFISEIETEYKIDN